MTSPYRSSLIVSFFCVIVANVIMLGQVMFLLMVYFNYLLSRDGNLNEYNNDKYAAGWMCDVTL